MDDVSDAPEIHEAALLEAVLADPVCTTILQRAPGLGLTEWLAPRAVYEAKVDQYTARWPSLAHDPW